MEKENIVYDKSYRFAIRIVKLSNYLDEKHAYAISTQIVKCGTSIGANIAESQQAQSRKDFISKLSISLKEVSETIYWLNLLKDTSYISEAQYDSMINDCDEIGRLLTAIIKSAKKDIE
ncbi:MAG: four helix bundle protein [Eubacterium sp.]|nr:four helix bundle protein [Eubacterium sp.]